MQPENLLELDIPIDYWRTAKNESFLFYDSGSEIRVIILEHENSEILELAQIWLANGTFKTVPILF